MLLRTLIGRFYEYLEFLVGIYNPRLSVITMKKITHPKDLQENQ